jgi:hypothetical protein
MHHSVVFTVARRALHPARPSSRPIFAAIALLLASPASLVEQAMAKSSQLPSASDGAKDEKKSADAADAKAEKFTLERFFPEKSFFGPSARSMTFSRDGRFGAFLYRSFPERRHGTDLYIVDTTDGRIRRITSVGRMAEHQASARKVRDERAKKAAAAGFTLPQLARDQYERLGWTDGMIAATDGDGQVYQYDFRMYVRVETMSFASLLTLFHDGGYEFTTDQVAIDTKAAIASGQGVLRGQGPSGNLLATGFEIKDNGNQINFGGLGRVTVQLMKAEKP